MKRVPISVPPLYMVSNLTSSQNFVAYISMGGDSVKVNLMNKKTRALNSFILPDQDIPTSIQYQTDNVLIITTQRCFYIYSENGQQLLKRLRNQIIQEDQGYFIGSLLCNDEYIIGQNDKLIYIDKNFKKDDYSREFKFQLSTIGLVDDWIVLGGQNGSIQIDNKEIDLKTLHITQIKQFKRKNLSTYAIIGDAAGRVNILDSKNWSIFCVINCHLRHISGLEILKEGFVTVSEDSYINIWKLGGLPTLQAQLQSEDSIIVGVTSDIFVAAYDQNELIFIQCE